MKAKHVLTAAFLIVLLAPPAVAAAPAGLLPAGPPAGVASPAAPGTEPALASRTTAPPAGIPTNWWASVQEDIRRSEYQITWQTLAADGRSSPLPGVPAAYQAPNRAQGFRTYFSEEGIWVVPRTGEGWELRLGLVGNEQRDQVRVAGNRYESANERIREWYLNDEGGLETGFRLFIPTSNLQLLEVGGWRLEITISGNLDPRVTADGASLELVDASGAAVLRYGPFQALDAAGREVPVHLSLDSSRLLVSPASPLSPFVYSRSHSWMAPLTLTARLTAPPQPAGSAGGLFPPSNWIAESNMAGAYFGVAVATAADVNGDGYSDVIVGAPSLDNGQTDEGRAYLYLGSATGLSPTPAWTAESNQATAYFADSVATAGDVNGDGYDDVIIGSWAYSNGQNDEGAAFVYYGSAGGLAPDPDWTAESNQADAHFGDTVGTAGDVNGDGYSEVIVGALDYDNGQADEGAAFVWHGSAGGLGPNGTPANADWTAESNQAGAQLGHAVGTAGDVNGDGYSDVIIGAMAYDSGQTDEGAAFVWHGSAGGLGPNGTPANADWQAESNQAGASFGFAAATAGDVDGDGFADVIVGARLYDSGENDEGGAFVYHGSASGLSPAPDWSAEGDQVGAQFGWALDTAGDVDGDGYGDVLIGAPYYDNDEGRAYVFHGSAGGLLSAPTWTAESGQVGAQFGYAVGPAGDVNGDGYGDVIVGALYYDSGQTDEGRAYVYYGSSAGLDPGPAWTAEGDQGSAWFGFAVGAAGDVDGDGYSDVIVGAAYYDNGEADEGRAYVYLGSAGGLSTSPAWTAESDQGGAQFGIAVGSAGDVDGDGYGDVIVGAYTYDNGELDEGRVYVYLGSPTGLSPDPAWTAEANQGSAYFGVSVGAAGDVNGDGYGDVVVGARYYDNGQTDEGRAYVYLGWTSGISTAPPWTAESDQASAQFGMSVDSAADVNGDGYDDVIMSAPYYDNGQIDEGRVYVYLGSAGGLSSAPAWTAESDQTGANFGWDVGTAGDANGDGYSDVVVGAYLYDKGQANEGAAFAWYGSATGLGANGTPANAAWTAESNQADSAFGGRVATAGDVNGDGYADVVVGATLYDYGQPDEGGAFVYHGSANGLSTTPAWTRVGEQAGAEAGVVGTAGDVNGDGYGDVIVGAYGYDDGPTWDIGAAFVFYGSPGGLSRAAAWTAESDQASAELGLSVGSAGDVNGDGYADVIVGAPYYDNGQADEGLAYVYQGSRAGLSPAPSWQAEGEQLQANLGYAVGTAGDVNGDGYADVVVGAPGFDNGQADEGAALVWHGSSTGLGPYGTPGNAQWRAEGDQVNAYLGRSAGTAGDVNGDGYADVVVGAYGYDNGETDEGRAYVFPGSAAGLLTSPAWSAEGDQANARFGWAVGTAGDVDGDAYSDLVVGAPRFDNSESDEGRAYVYRGSTGGLSSAPTWTAQGGQAGAQFGFAVATAGDTDGDGYADVVVGTPYHDHGLGRPDVGRAYLYRGSPTGTLPGPDWTAEGDQAGAFLGYAVGTAGDVDGDGYADVVVGAPYYSNGPADEGRVLVYHGAVSGLSATAHWTAESNQPSVLLGYAVGSAGDVNGDGVADVAVGVPFYTNGFGQEAEGAAFLYYGNGGDGLDLVPRQMRTDGSGPIAPLGMSDSPNAVQLRLTGRMPVGREEVRLQWQAAPLSTPFTATTAISGTSVAWTDTLTTGLLLVQDVSGLIPGAPYHWRVRLLYRPGNLLGQPAGRWVHVPWNSWTEEAFRTPGQCSPPGGASFDWMPTLPAPGETITFTAVATGTPPLALTWDWGDGQRASGATVTHSYALSGTYAVLMTVAGPCGSRALVTRTVAVGIPEGGARVYLPLVYKQ